MEKFSSLIDKDSLIYSQKAFERLGLNNIIKNKTFLDIGCGSGINLITSLRFGAKSVYGIDIDPVCIQTSKEVLLRFTKSKNWKVYNKSIFNVIEKPFKKFDVVYSWGVLHHTGDMFKALTIATSLVKKNGYLCVALYQKTFLCKLWRLEKLIYVKSPKFFRNLSEVYLS